jgi:hypothetical protein
MKYERPHILSLKSALEMITTVQVDKSIRVLPERDFTNPSLSAGAYEADE